MSEASLPHIPERFRLNPEFRLLVACSWIAPPKLEQEQVETIASLCRREIDWKEFLALVRRHGVPGLTYTMLCRHAGDRLPGTIRDILKADHIQTAGQALRQSAELLRISSFFAENSIELIVMKGVLLSQRLYGSPAIRSSTDIDLMVKLEDFDRADQLIRAAGYRCTSPGSMLTDRQKRFHRSIGQNCEYFNAGNGISLEIHWRSYLSSQEQTDILWGYVRSFEWGGVIFSTWEDDALILSLCYHGAHHEWCNLKWLSDVAVLISQDRPDDWASLLELSDRLGMRRVLAQSALLAHWLYGFPLPGPLCALIEEEKSSIVLCSTAIRAMLKSSTELATVGRRMDNLRHSRYLVQLIPAISYFAIIKSNVINFVDFERFPIPDRLFWLYIPLRPVFWFWRNYIRPANGRRNPDDGVSLPA